MCRLIWLTQHYFPNQGGMAQSCDRITRHLRETNIQVDIVHFSRKNTHWHTEQKQNGRIFTCPITNDAADTMNRLWSLLSHDPHRDEITHVVAFGGILPVTAAPVFASWLDVPLLVMLRGNDFDVTVFSHRHRPVLQDAVERASIVSTVSKEMCDKITAFYPRAKTICIPNGINTAQWHAMPADYCEAQRWKSLHANGKQVVGLFGHIKPKKGALFFLDSLLKSGFSDRFHLLFVGELQPDIQYWLLENSFRLTYTHLSFTDRFQLIPFYLACDFVAIPSFYDGMPNVMLEAMALGIPLVATRVGGMADVVIDKVHGFTFIPGDIHSCRQAIHAMADATPGIRLQLGEKAKQFVIDTLNHEVETKRYLQVLKSIGVNKNATLAI
jgi:glycogen(starch) synthase